MSSINALVFSVSPVIFVWAVYFQTIKLCGAPTEGLKSNMALSALITSVSTIVQPGFAVLWFLHPPANRSHTPDIAFGPKLLAVNVALFSLAILASTVAVALVHFASQFHASAITQGLQVSYSACFSLLASLVLPLPGSALLFLLSRAVPSFLLSPSCVMAAFGLGVYGLVDFSTRTEMPGWLFNQVACYQNTLMCMR